jgi:hypothetical protein
LDLNALLEKVAYVSHQERLATYAALTEAERVAMRAEVEETLADAGDQDNELVWDLKRLRICIAGPGR